MSECGFYDCRLMRYQTQSAFFIRVQIHLGESRVRENVI